MKGKLPFQLEKLKKINRSHLLIAGLMGILLLVIAIPVEENASDPDSSGQTERLGNSRVSEGENDGNGTTASEAAGIEEQYCSQLEEQLEEMLAVMEGVGEVRVMITLKDAGEAVVEKDTRQTSDHVEEKDAQGGEGSQESLDVQETSIYVQGDGSGQHPFVSKEIKPQVEGVLVVAQGGGNAVVVKNISDAVLALFPVEVHRIKVVKMN